MASSKRNRPDKDGSHRLAYERNKAKIMATQTVCGICGKPVDKSLRYPHPLSPCIDTSFPWQRVVTPATSTICSWRIGHATGRSLTRF